jgi:predicted AlkP superfamily pyrophosphatase or phosphodiesterase
MDSVEMPATRALMEQGCYTLKKRTVLPSVSAPNWASMFMGATTELTGWTNNGERAPLEPAYVNENGVFPTIFSLIREQMPKAKTACIFEWGGIRPLVDEKAIDHCVQLKPEDIAAASAEHIKKEKPDFMAIIYDDPDHVGHSAGHATAEYYAKMEELDACLGEILGAIKEAGIYDDSIFIITSDHGGINTSHGGRSLMEMDTPFVIAGKNVKKGGEFSEAMMQYDTAATIAEAFGLKTPQLWRGQSMSQVFE